MANEIRIEDYQTLAGFRFELRRFLRFSEQAARGAGLTPQQYQALLALRAAPDSALKVGELADCLLLRAHSTTELIDRLSRLGVVARDYGGKDGRNVRVTLTQAGREALESLSAAHRAELLRIRPLLQQLISRL